MPIKFRSCQLSHKFSTSHPLQTGDFHSFQVKLQDLGTQQSKGRTGQNSGRRRTFESEKLGAISTNKPQKTTQKANLSYNYPFETALANFGKRHEFRESSVKITLDQEPFSV
jgi:hypothetical protein